MNRKIRRLWTGILACLLTVSLLGCTFDVPMITTAPTTTAFVPDVVLVTDPPGTDVYTYRDHISQMPKSWNPHNWTSSSEQYIVKLTAPGLYTFGINEEGTGYELQPDMAAGAPVDVTAEYAGYYGVPGDADWGYAYRIPLNPDAVWDDGTPITADTYLYSMKQLLSSEYDYDRADRFVNGQLRLANALDYCMQDQVGTRIYRSLADAGYRDVSEARNDGIENLYINVGAFWGLNKDWLSIYDNDLIRDEAVPSGKSEDYVSAKYLYNNYLADGQAYSAYQSTFVGLLEKTVEETDFDDVGILKTGEYELTLILEKAASAQVLQAELTEGWLVREELYGPEYGTSVETSSSCGPYKLTQLEEQGFLLERNKKWFGYVDGLYEGQYQADAVSCQVYATREEIQDAFDGNLLDTAVLSEMQSMTQSSMTNLTLNTSMRALKKRETDGVNKRILYMPEFRKAISLAVNREELAANWVSDGKSALGLLGSGYVTDLAAGERYRNSIPGQHALEQIYGNTETGYQVETAAALLQSAYDSALENDYIGENDAVELEILVSGEEDYADVVAFLQEAIQTAAEGTSLENRIKLVLTADPAWEDRVQNGDFDMTFATKTGTIWDPWSVMADYCMEDRKLEFGFEPSVELCTLSLWDIPMTKTYRGWYEVLVNGKYADYPLETRVAILAGLEYGLLSGYNSIPLYEQTVSRVDSGRIQRAVAGETPMLGSEGVRYAVFIGDDAQWIEQTGVEIRSLEE